ncbi:MAG: TrkH family potassium uptake protein [Alphaproteobacteria bacterium]|nr:TrkH family potassium uptake protein [Alphaproteobacteria bacterium]
MIDLRSVFYLTGIVLCCLAIAMSVPLLVEALVYKTLEWKAFGVSMVICGFFGSSLALSNPPHGKTVLGMREAFLVTSVIWIILSIFAGLPFYYSEFHFTFINACFEAVSALTTTGSTIMDGIDDAPKGILLWRALLQCIGGTGIILMAMTIFPILRIGGMQLFRSEFSDRSEKILPRVSQIAAAILGTYLFFIFACMILLYWAGMPFFDATCSAMATVSTGGLTTKDCSIGFYNDPLIESIIAVFMIIGGSTLILFVLLWKGERKAIFEDSQLRAYLMLLVIASLIVTLWQWGMNQQSFLHSLRLSTFSVISVVTTTGLVTSDYGSWGNFPIIIFFLLSFIGGCTGSTTGGIKIFRFQVLFALTRTHLMQLRKPHGMYVPTYQGQKISSSAALSVFTFLTLYFLCMAALACALSIAGLDFIASLSGAAASLGNVGPGLGPLIGPHTSFAQLPDAAKILMMAGMILGRLELLTVLVLFMPSFWQD